MLKNRNFGLLNQIINRCNRIIKKTTNIEENEFYEEDDFVEIVCFNLFQIGELANSLSNEVNSEYNKIPWRQIIGMRNRIVHGYDNVDYEVIWNTAKESILELKSYCEEIIQFFK